MLRLTCSTLLLLVLCELCFVFYKVTENTGMAAQKSQRLSAFPVTEAQAVRRVAGDSETYPWISGAELEYRLWDDTRVDALTDEHAIEFDWADKWAEAIGQSLYYSQTTKRKAGICLLIRDKVKDKKYVYRCRTVADNHGITVWLVYVNLTP